MQIDLDTSMYGTLNDLWAVEEYSEAGWQHEFTTVTDMCSQVMCHLQH